jgi:hypothetical protein
MASEMCRSSLAQCERPEPAQERALEGIAIVRGEPEGGVDSRRRLVSVG